MRTSLSQLTARFIRSHWKAYTYSAVLLVIVDALVVWVPRRVGSIIDGLAKKELNGQELASQLAWLLVLGLAIYLVRIGWRRILYAAAFQFGVEIRARLYDRLSQQGPGFFQSKRTGDLMALSTNDVDAVELAAGEAMLGLFDGSVTLVMVLGMISLGVDWRLTSLALLPFPIMGLAFWHISRKVHETATEELNRFSRLNEHVQESFSGIRTLRALGLEKSNTKQFIRLTHNAAKANLAALKWEAGYDPAISFTLSTASAITLGYGGYLVWHNQLSTGMLTSFIMYLGQLVWPMFAAGWVLSMLERGRAGWGRIRDVLEEPLTIKDGGFLLHAPSGAIVAKSLNFSYSSQSPNALSNVEFILPPGHTLGIVGPTGSGKSTLLKLLLRQFSPDSGQLHWGKDLISDFKLAAFRDCVSWVPQEPFLFSATLCENISLAKPEATQSEIEHVATLASIHADILGFPNGYETLVGERGITLSGGQRQRIALARALLCNRPLLLLDDALSAVDTETEAKILNHLRDVRNEPLSKSRGFRSTILVSHRLSALIDADQILVLKEGRIVEVGNHASLLALRGWYAKQWRYQQLEASIDAI